jgi:hypothetical protein
VSALEEADDALAVVDVVEVAGVVVAVVAVVAVPAVPAGVVVVASDTVVVVEPAAVEPDVVRAAPVEDVEAVVLMYPTSPTMLTTLRAPAAKRARWAGWRRVPRPAAGGR